MSKQTPLILIVEDAVEVAEIIRIAFRRTEISIQHRANAPSALEFLETTLPDAIILDIGMPGMNGWEFLEIVRDNDRTKDIPVIVLTSYSDSQNRKTGRLFEVAAFMQKPIDLEKLRSVLDNAIYTRNPKNT